MNLSTIGQIAMNVHDIERATAFYRDTLGLPFLFSAGTMAFFDCHGTRLMLGLPSGPEYDHPGSILYFKVDDIHAVHAALEARGVPFKGKPHLVARMPDHELWMAFFTDSEENTLALMAELQKEANSQK
jgi:methylmalonyl-CoA/ethylmalonyl-CoA epimerase